MNLFCYVWNGWSCCSVEDGEYVVIWWSNVVIGRCCNLNVVFVSVVIGNNFYLFEDYYLLVYGIFMCCERWSIDVNLYFSGWGFRSFDLDEEICVLFDGVWNVVDG